MLSFVEKDSMKARVLLITLNINKNRFEFVFQKFKLLLSLSLLAFVVIKELILLEKIFIHYDLERILDMGITEKYLLLLIVPLLILVLECLEHLFPPKFMRFELLVVTLCKGLSILLIFIICYFYKLISLESQSLLEWNVLSAVLPYFAITMVLHQFPFIIHKLKPNMIWKTIGKLEVFFRIIRKVNSIGVACLDYLTLRSSSATNSLTLFIERNNKITIPTFKFNNRRYLGIRVNRLSFGRCYKGP